MKCHDCGSPLEGKVSKSGLLTCAYCGAGYDLRATTPQAAPLIARADFSGPALKGWRYGSAMHGRLQDRGWSITQPHDGQNHPLLVAPGAYDDFDVRARFRFVSADGLDRFFFRGRSSEAGAMSLHFSYEGLVSLHWQMPGHEWRDCLANVRPALDTDPNSWRELRWVAVGPRHLAYLDGVLVIRTLHPQVLHTGYLDVRIQTISPSVSLEVAELALYEAGN